MTRHIIRANYDKTLSQWNFLIYDDVQHCLVLRQLIGSEYPSYSMNVGIGGLVSPEVVN